MSQVAASTDRVSENEYFVPQPYKEKHVRRKMDDLINEVSERIAPVWPLKDYVAVNPFAGVAERPFLDARSFLRIFSDCETLMPLGYYAKAYQRGEFGKQDIRAAYAELSEQLAWQPDAVNLEKLIETLAQWDADPSDQTTAGTVSHHRQVRTIAEIIGEVDSIDWQDAIKDEVSKHCASHYDHGQSTWKNSWNNLPLYQAWKQVASIDRNVEVLGLPGFRDYVKSLPHTPDAAILGMLAQLQIPESLWVPFLLCQAYSVPGWSAWAKYQASWSDDPSRAEDFIGVIAMRLAYDVAVKTAFGVNYQWETIAKGNLAAFKSDREDDSLARFVLLRSSELAVRDRMFHSMRPAIRATKNLNADSADAGSKRKLAQMVFCIDVRSERLRRQLELASPEIETHGFAGFFGMPLEVVRMGESFGDASLPVLLKPQIRVHEGFEDDSIETKAVEERTNVRSWRGAWKSLQTSAVGCFPFVETAGLLAGWKLIQRTLLPKTSDFSTDGVALADQDGLGPKLSSLDEQGITQTERVDLMESMLRNLGLVDQFARLVVLCGHHSETSNNPLAAGLDCGACGGHSGEPNAKFAAAMLNDDTIRQGLKQRGIEIPSDTLFMAGTHNTTTDAIKLYGADSAPAAHQSDIDELQDIAQVASGRTREKRLQTEFSSPPELAQLKASDWSEVRPEWGLAGNAAFIVGPRALTKDTDLGGRAFLHSYNQKLDPEFATLETIMTAPMVVAHWINMQYYASTVDNDYFGSGNKTVHNVVGRFGLLSGNSGDLMTGLPWQSLHDGEDYQHKPVRLQSVIHAPRSAVSAIISKHDLLINLLSNGWIHLSVIEDGELYHYQLDGEWQRENIDNKPSVSELH